MNLIRAFFIVLALAYLADANATTCKNGANDYPTCTSLKSDPPKHRPRIPAPAPMPVPATTPAPTIVVVPAAQPAPAAAPVSLAADLTPSQVATLRQQAAGTGTGTGSGTGGNVTDQSVTNQKGSYALGLNLPGPVSTPPMATVICATPEITQDASGGWLFGATPSSAHSKTSTQDCVALAVIDRPRMRDCRHRTVALAENALLEKSLPGLKLPPVPQGVQDLSPDECNKPVAAIAQPPAQPAPPPVQKISLASDALFDFDKAVLKPGGRAKLDDLASKLQGEHANIVVTGHTDSRGSDQYNMSLSMRRANAVRAHLALAGIDVARMIAVGKGKTEPVSDNSTEAGRALNRRVDVQITVQPASPKLASMVGRAASE